MLLESAMGWAECVIQNILMMYLLTGIGSVFLGPHFYLLYLCSFSNPCLMSISAADGPDLLAQELDLVKNIELAVKEERYKDAGNLTFRNPFVLADNVLST